MRTPAGKGEMTRKDAIQRTAPAEGGSPPPAPWKFRMNAGMQPEESEPAKTRHFTRIPDTREKRHFRPAETTIDAVLRILKNK